MRWSTLADPEFTFDGMTDRASLSALRNMIAEVETLISTAAPMPENRTPRSLELLRAAKALTDDLLAQNRVVEKPH